jgi:HEPN domain-containing protein
MSVPESVGDWIALAEEDLLNIENNLSASRVPWSTVCFHAQQGAEKYLKAPRRGSGWSTWRMTASS